MSKRLLVNKGRDEWIETNGQTISDTKSPLDRQTLLNLNYTEDIV